MGLVIDTRRVIQVWNKIKSKTKSLPHYFSSPPPAAVVAVGGTDVGESPVSLHPVRTEGNNVWWEPGGKRWVSAAGLLCCPERWVSKKGKRSVKCGQL